MTLTSAQGLTQLLVSVPEPILLRPLRSICWNGVPAAIYLSTTGGNVPTAFSSAVLHVGLPGRWPNAHLSTSYLWERHTSPRAAASIHISPSSWSRHGSIDISLESRRMRRLTPEPLPFACALIIDGLGLSRTVPLCLTEFPYCPRTGRETATTVGGTGTTSGPSQTTNCCLGGWG